MEQFQEKEFSLSDINDGQRYQNGDIVDASVINAVIEASAYAVTMAKTALDLAKESAGGVSADFSQFATKNELSQYAPKTDLEHFKTFYAETWDASATIDNYVPKKVEEFCGQSTGLAIYFNVRGSHYWGVGFNTGTDSQGKSYGKFIVMQYGSYGVKVFDCMDGVWTVKTLTQQ